LSGAYVPLSGASTPSRPSQCPDHTAEGICQRADERRRR
jgi:hypothetical protein